MSLPSRGGGGEHHGGAAFEQAAAGVGEREAIEDVIAVAGQALGAHLERPGQVVEAGDAQRDAAHAGEIALTRRRLRTGEQGAVHRHRLRGVFDAGGGAEAACGAQRMGGVEVAHRAAQNRGRRPFQHRIEQAHVALVRDVRGDPAPV